jgi:hypothetical protein
MSILESYLKNIPLILPPQEQYVASAPVKLCYALECTDAYDSTKKLY